MGEEGGATALGPALAAGIAMAGKIPGSKVVVCTDGLANVGLGSLESKVEAEIDKTEAFYAGLGDAAKIAGTTVSVISIIGDEAKLEFLGQVSDATGGEVDRLDVTKLSSEFNSILAKPVQATNVQISLQLHRGLMFRDDGSAEIGIVAPAAPDAAPAAAACAGANSAACPIPLSQLQNVVTKDVGNVNEDSEEYFEYAVRSSSERAAMGVSESIKSLPFQARISYTRLDGMRCMRVISASKAISAKREEVEKCINMKVMSGGAAQSAAKFAQRGDYMSARITSHAYRNTMERCLGSSVANVNAYRTWCTTVGDMDESIQQMQQQEMEDGFVEEMAEGRASKSTSKARKGARSDKAAVMQLKMKKASGKTFFMEDAE